MDCEDTALEARRGELLAAAGIAQDLSDVLAGALGRCEVVSEELCVWCDSGRQNLLTIQTAVERAAGLAGQLRALIG